MFSGWPSRNPRKIHSNPHFPTHFPLRPPGTIPGMESRSLTNMHGLARRFGLPASWFREEAEAGRLPCLKVGRRLFFNLVAVEQALAERAASGRAGPGKAVAHA